MPRMCHEESAREFSTQLDERIHGIGHATAANLAIVDHERGLVRDGRSNHLQP